MDARQAAAAPSSGPDHRARFQQCSLGAQRAAQMVAKTSQGDLPADASPSSRASQLCAQTKTRAMEKPPETAAPGDPKDVVPTSGRLELAATQQLREVSLPMEWSRHAGDQAAMQTARLARRLHQEWTSASISSAGRQRLRQQVTHPTRQPRRSPATRPEPASVPVVSTAMAPPSHGGEVGPLPSAPRPPTGPEVPRQARSTQQPSQSRRPSPREQPVSTPRRQGRGPLPLPRQPPIRRDEKPTVRASQESETHPSERRPAAQEKLDAKSSGQPPCQAVRSPAPQMTERAKRPGRDDSASVPAQEIPPTLPFRKSASQTVTVADLD